MSATVDNEIGMHTTTVFSFFLLLIRRRNAERGDIIAGIFAKIRFTALDKTPKSSLRSLRTLERIIETVESHRQRFLGV
jgi:hypothetical protein